MQCKAQKATDTKVNDPREMQGGQNGGFRVGIKTASLEPGDSSVGAFG